MATAAQVPAQDPGQWQWSALPVATRAVEQGALALDSSGQRLAVSDERGLWLVEWSGEWSEEQGPTVGRSPVDSSVSRQLFGCRDVRDLAFANDGSLWVATGKGLCLLPVKSGVSSSDPSRNTLTAEPARLETLPLGRGTLGVSRLGLAGELRVLGTTQGLLLSHASSGWRQWQKAPTDLPKGEVTALAVRDASSGKLEQPVWNLVMGASGQLWEMEVRWQRSAGFAFSKLRRHRIADSGLRIEPLELFFDVMDADLLVLESKKLFSCRRQSREAPCAWATERLVLPPGVETVGAWADEQGLWLATPRGLFWRSRAGKRFDPFLEATDHSSVLAVAAQENQAVFVGERGVFLGRPALPRGPLADEGHAIILPENLGAGEPTIEEVQRAALFYLDLDPSWMRKLREGVVRRGALPVVQLRLTADRARTHARDYDEAFISSQLHKLNDWDRDEKHDYGVSLNLSWDLADLAYHPESIDVSDEARDVMELRDEILDELTQLYFDRRRVLLELAVLEASQPVAFENSSQRVEAERLRLRADELVAGIDAWTGGWFSAQLYGEVPGES